MAEPVTVEGLRKIKNELSDLISRVRPEIIEAIERALEHGDLKENSEYHSAKEKQSFTEGRIQELNGIISNADVIDTTSLPKDRVVFGTKVKLLEEETSKSVIYQIVGKYESDLKMAKIAYDSPIAKALIGKRVGDLVEVKAPKGIIEYTVEDIL